MEISIFLARAFAIYLIIISIAILFRRKSFLDNINAMMEHRPTLYLSAIITLILGILLVLSHNLWVANWQVVITLLAWFVLIKGTVRVLFPEWDDKWKHTFDSKKVSTTIGIIALIIGIYLFVMGFLLN